ncbi:hypothetical protein [Streptomyces sp. NPDC006270]|uniref:hypothetical protein n=1 Tax=Streptomyces sp. NPDC006270 TaxID=3364741 RepID=UPI0036BD00FD
MTQDVFENLARHAIRAEEALRLEFVNGKPGVKAAPDGDHGRIVEWLTRLCMQADPNRWLYPDGVRYEQVVTVPYGRTVSLPGPVGIELDTEPLKSWVR